MSISEKRGFGWESNCFVWALEFKAVPTVSEEHTR